jgi:uncharacterized protein (DUF1015 family)
LADVRPFRGLRYHTEAAGELSDLISPPFDVIGPEAQDALHRRSPHNIVRLELGEARDSDTVRDNRYTRAAAFLREWQERGILLRDETPRFYVLDQEFEHDGQWRQRRALLARVRIEEWDRGIVRPHEQTLAAPKQDRLELLRHVRADLSPIFSLYSDAGGRIASALDSTLAEHALARADQNRQRHTLRALTDPATIQLVSDELRAATLYIADGHHRYETALTYRDERQAQLPRWSGEEGENFVLMALVAAQDPGLLLLPTHRLVRLSSRPSDVMDRLRRHFRVEDVSSDDRDTAMTDLIERLAGARPKVAIGAAGLEEGRLHLLTLEDSRAAQAFMPSDHSQAWRSLDVSVLHYVILGATLGITSGGAEHESALTYTEDAAEALRQVDLGAYALAFLLNPTPVEQVLAVADAAERMPQKSTFFCPKMPTGLVVYPLD